MDGMTLALSGAGLMAGLIGLPLVAALVVALIGGRAPGAVRIASMTAVGLNLLLTAGLVAVFLSSPPAPTGEAGTFLPRVFVRIPVLQLGLDSTGPAVQFFVGVDGLNIWLLALTAVLMVPAVLASWGVTERANEYHAWLHVLLAGMNGVFLAFDVILFYAFFELTLVPLYFLVGGWGGNGRREAARKLFLYTLAGSLLTLVGVLALVVVTADREPRTAVTFSIPELVRNLEAKAKQSAADLSAAKEKRARAEEAIPAARAASRAADKAAEGPRAEVARRTEAARAAGAERSSQVTALESDAVKLADAAKAIPAEDPKRKEADEKAATARKKADDAKAAFAALKKATDDAAPTGRAATAAEAAISKAEGDLKGTESAVQRVRDERAARGWFGFAVFLLIVAGFAVKVPVVPLHTWLPPAYTEAPLPVTFLLAGVLAKMGTYGLLRLVIPLMPDASVAWGMPILGTLGAVGIVYGALCAYAQTDMKRLVAFSSLSHLGFIVVGLFALNPEGISGGLLQMVNHGLTTGALFLLVGMVADRYAGTRSISAFGGLMGRWPVLTFLMMVAVLASVGLPGLNSFVAEVLMLAGVVKLQSPLGYWMAAAGAAGVVLGAWYLFTMLKGVYFGPLKEPTAAMPANDATGRELATVLPLLALCLALGLFPQPILRSMEPDLNVVTNLTAAAKARALAE